MKFLLSLLLALRVLSAAVAADELQQTAIQHANLETQLEALFAPGRDVLDVKLAIDAMLEPSARIDESRAAVNELSTTLLPWAKGARTSHDKLKVLRRFIYEAGPWNSYRPFVYDMADPSGKNPNNQMLTSYLQTRLGNCVTMPILVMILGRRLGLRMTLVDAPSHVFVKFTDDLGKEWNLEATSGAGYTRDVWYRQNISMKDEAVTNGTYLRALGDEEVKALMLSSLASKELKIGSPENAIVIANVMLRHAPRLVLGWLYRGSAYGKLLRRDITEPFPDLAFLPPDIRAYAETLYRQNLADFAQAEALGWTERDGVKQ